MLSGPKPGTYCWYIGENIDVCDGDIDTNYTDICLPNEQNCLLHQPDDLPRDGTDTCYTRVDYSTVGDSFLYGDCEHHAAYWSSDPAMKAMAECLFHSHCPDGKLCVDYQCE